ncbi:MAG TPA: hypothetical protein VI434_09220 [Candidatus Dormibacteraeota bacterium]
MTISPTDVGFPFPQSALATNASGRLTDDQRRQWRANSRGYRRSELSFFVILVIIGALVAFAPGPAKDATIKPIIGIVCFVIAALLLVRALTGGDAISEDVRAGRVESVEGAITKFAHTGNGRGSSSTAFYLDVAGKRLHVYRAGYLAAPGVGYVRLYYLPKSRHVINLERLPDPVTPALTPANAQSAVQDLLAHRRHDENSLAETRANMAAMASQLKAQMQQNAVQPPPDQRDARPLAEAIVGTWTSAFMTVSFAPDGTATSTAPNGRQTTGRWSVDAQGQLHAGLAGKDNVGQAWISGTTLTISEEGMGITFERSGS